jgi:tetratricopeptide (TPR) repeat protein
MSEKLSKKNNFTNQKIKGRDASVAWFKLSELVARGEKEKALNLYRLISHYVDNRAYVLQLEGDILWAFEDKASIDRYKEAAFLYKKEKKIANAIAIYEHMIFLQPENYKFVSSLIEFYCRLGWNEKISENLGKLLRFFENKDVSLEYVEKTLKSAIVALTEKNILEDNVRKGAFKTLMKKVGKATPEIVQTLEEFFEEKIA